MTEEVISSGFIQNPIDGSNIIPPPAKKKRNLPGTPDPEAEVIALSPKTLMATNRFLCEICGKGFQRDQNLQLHRRGHNLPWKLKQRTSKEVRKRVYVCPEKTCVHHHPSRALGDLTGIKKHFCRKHGEKKWKCEKCSKRYAVQSDWKAHSKTCGTREYKCDCGTIFSRRDSFITHRAFCDALAEETARMSAASSNVAANSMNYHLVGSGAGAGAGAGALSSDMGMGQHFSSIFKPIPSNDDIETTNPLIRQGLSLWMGQQQQGSQSHGQEAINSSSSNLQELHHHLGSVTSGQIFPTDPLFLISCSNHPPPTPLPAPPPPPTTSYQLNWDFGNNKQLSSNESEELAIVKDGGSQLAMSVPSLFSTQLHQTTPSVVNMSATALLQKAAQIGASTSDPSVLGAFGLKCNDNHVHEGNKFCGFYGANSIVTSMESSSVVHDDDDLSSLNQFQVYRPSNKRRHIHQNDQDSSTIGGQTRDFLGVGICHPSSINGWI